jgi:hypothetical protein
MSELVEAALRLLFRGQRSKKKKLPRLPIFRGGGISSTLPIATRFTT